MIPPSDESSSEYVYLSYIFNAHKEKSSRFFIIEGIVT